MKRPTAILSVLLLGLTACAGDDTDDSLASADSLAFEQPTTMPPADGMDQQQPMGMGETAQMAPLNDSGVEGEVTVTDRGGETEVLVRLTRAPADGTHPGHVHTGSCESLGGVVQPLEPITVDATGTGTMTTNVAIPPATLMDGQHIVVYHGEGGAPVTCAAIAQHMM